MMIQNRDLGDENFVKNDCESKSKKENKMAKPIFLVGLPKSTDLPTAHAIRERLENKLEQYYTLIYPSNNDHFEFKCFHEKDINEVTYEEFKKILSDISDKIKTPQSY